MPEQDFTQYVTEFIDNGNIRYAVGRWDQKRGQFYAPLDKTTARLTGCFGEFSRTPVGMPNYKTRKQALRRARYLFGDRICR